MTEWKVCTLAKTVLTHNILIPHTPSIVSTAGVSDMPKPRR